MVIHHSLWGNLFPSLLGGISRFSWEYIPCSGGVSLVGLRRRGKDKWKERKVWTEVINSGEKLNIKACSPK